MPVNRDLNCFRSYLALQNFHSIDIRYVNTEAGGYASVLGVGDRHSPPTGRSHFSRDRQNIFHPSEDGRIVSSSFVALSGVVNQI